MQTINKDLYYKYFNMYILIYIYIYTVYILEKTVNPLTEQTKFTKVQNCNLQTRQIECKPVN